MPTYYGKNGEMRFYDGTGTPNYIVLRFSEMNLTVPEGANRPEESIRLNRGQLDANAHYIQGLDDPIVEAVQMTTSFRLESGAGKELVHEFLGLRFASGQDATWNAGSGSTALVTTKGTSAGRPAGLSGTLVTLPLFTDPKKVCVNCEGLWDDLTGNKVGRKLTETYFRPGEQSLNEAPDGVLVNLNGQVYGQIASITAFTAGTQLT
jgi:hypothetical protein